MRDDSIGALLIWVILAAIMFLGREEARDRVSHLEKEIIKQKKNCLIIKKEVKR